MLVIEELRNLWAEVLCLDLEEVEDNANFFECKNWSPLLNQGIVAHLDSVGGDSVRGIQLVGRAASLNLNLSLNALFDRRSGLVKKSP